MSEIPDRLSATLADRYTIERKLGEGGMATVYVAKDLKHERQVALKVLKPELARAIGSERFLREIKITAGLSHPHILPLLDSGEADGFLYYVMPFVAGETLADRLAREKQLPLDDALDIAREVGDALSYAHSQGVIHRDIKPANILLQSRHAMVADFGIGRAIDAAGGDHLTETGMSVGTPAYMSPEQCGAGDVDGRSDLYSLACMLYEMLAGQPPFTGPTVESLVHQHLAAEPAPITQIRPAVPAEVAGVLQRALAKNPADRFNPVAQFSDALRTSATSAPVVAGTAESPTPSRMRFAIPIMAVIVLVAAVVLWPRGSSGASAAADTPSVAVLPFENIGGDPKNEYFSDGITEDIIAHVSKVSGLKVISRTSVMQYKGATAPIRDIARDLDVTTVLEGSVRRAGNQVRVVAQLVDAQTAQHLWAATYDRDLENIFAIQTDIAQNIANALGAVFQSSDTNERPPTDNIAAYDLYLRGRVLMAERTGDALRGTVDYLRRAIDLDPRFAQAYAALAEAWVLYPIYTVTSALPALDSVRRAADSALALDPLLPGAHAARGFASALWLWDFAAGESSLREAIRLDPGYATAHHWLGVQLATLGRYDEAEASLRRALELDPLSRIIGSDLAVSFFVARNFAASEAQFRTVMQLDPRFPPAYRLAAWLYGATGRDSLAAEMLERWNVLLGEPAFPVGELRSAHAFGGRRAMYERLLEASTTPQAVRIDVAFWYTALGRRAEAIETLERAADSLAMFVGFLAGNPLYDSLRDEPRFQALLTRIYRQ